MSVLKTIIILLILNCFLLSKTKNFKNKQEIKYFIENSEIFT